MKPYPKYKDSGIEWIGEIPEHWDFRKLSRSLDFIKSGSTPISDNPNYYEEGTVSWIQSGDLNDGIIKKTKKKVTEFALAEYSTLQVYPKGCLIIAMYGATIGKLGIMDFDGCCNQACCVMKGSKYSLIKYLYYWFLANKNNIIQLSIGGGQPNISQDIIKSLKITCPPIEEQKQIIKFLDNKTNEIDDLISKKQQMIELLKEQRAAVINEAVTKGLDKNVKMKDSGVEWIGEVPAHWEVKCAKYLLEINTEALTENTKSDYEFNYIDIGNVDLEEGIKLEDKITFGTAPSRARRIVKKGDTIVSTVRTYLKAIAYFNNYVEDVIVSTGFAVLRPVNYIIPKYLYYVVRSEKFIERICALSIGVSYPAINASDIANISIWYPDSEKEQIEIVKYLDAIVEQSNKAMSVLMKEIELLKEYRTALIFEVVTGKIQVNH